MFPHVHQGNLSQIDAQIDMMQEQISMCDGQMQELWPVLMDNIQNHSADKLKQVAEQLKVEQENKEKYMMALVKLYTSPKWKLFTPVVNLLVLSKSKPLMLR